MLKVHKVIRVIMEHQDLLVFQLVLYCYGLVQYLTYRLVGCYVMVLVVLQI